MKLTFISKRSISFPYVNIGSQLICTPSYNQNQFNLITSKINTGKLGLPLYPNTARKKLNQL